MDKKVFLLFVFLIFIFSGCSSKTEEPMVVLCDKVDIIIENYRSNKFDSTEFIEKIKALERECITDDYLCSTGITSFKYLNSDSKKEILDANANELDRDCKLIREKYQK